ncbi:MAG: PPC domain-containing protein [Gemmatimonadota bacterium]
MRGRLVWFVPLLVVVAASCQKSASGRSVSVGKSVGDSLTSRDPARQNRGPYQVWTLRGKKGQRLAIDMTSTAFDPFLAVRDADGLLIGSDDDGGEGLNAQLHVILPRAGTYRVIATSINGSARGWYTLAVSEWATPDVLPGGREGALNVGDAKTGLLEPGDEQAGDGPFQDRWAFQARQGQRYRVEMSSSDLDSYLTIVGPDGQVVAANDDAGNGRDAMVTFTATTAGRYAALASNYGDQLRFGTYRVTLAEAAAATGTAAIREIGGDVTVEGRLEDGDSMMGNGLVDVYTYTPAHAGTVTIDLRSTEFDALLTIESEEGTELARDDDSGGERNSRLTFTMSAGTRYRIRVGAFGSSQRSVGAYSLSVRAGGGPVA